MTPDSKFTSSPEAFSRKRKTVLVIAGSDPSGGAGVQGDIKTCMANDVFAMGVITALTVQNTVGVKAFTEVPPEMIASQMEYVVEDIMPDAVKIGMLPSADAVIAVADIIRRFNLKNIVIDPVLISSSGKTLSKDAQATGEAMKEHIFPLATLVTPNIPEACFLSGRKQEDTIYPDELTRELLKDWRCRAILLKGGHAAGDECSDILRIKCEKGDITKIYRSKRIFSRNTHGTGCALSSAIASGLARGLGIEEAVARGKEFVTAALQGNAGVRFGHGHGPLDFFAKF